MLYSGSRWSLPDDRPASRETALQARMLETPFVLRRRQGACHLCEVCRDTSARLSASSPDTASDLAGIRIANFFLGDFVFMFFATSATLSALRLAPTRIVFEGAVLAFVEFAGIFVSAAIRSPVSAQRGTHLA